MPADNDAVKGFTGISLAELDALPKEHLDVLPFGVIGLSRSCLVEVYNATESRLAGLSASSVLGSHFFLSTAQCMNNFLVAQRFADEEEIDATIDFVLTLRMRPTPVRLRMLKSATSPRFYILIQR